MEFVLVLLYLFFVYVFPIIVRVLMFILRVLFTLLIICVSLLAAFYVFNIVTNGENFIHMKLVEIFIDIAGNADDIELWYLFNIIMNLPKTIVSLF